MTTYKHRCQWVDQYTKRSGLVIGDCDAFRRKILKIAVTDN
ncbi:hypothetical protein [Xenorhabdus bovienii]|nr:hypothetical protein [Xenorhabdus bovienii]